MNNLFVAVREAIVLFLSDMFSLVQSHFIFKEFFFSIDL
jgi:hypothetical protein